MTIQTEKTAEELFLQEVQALIDAALNAATALRQSANVTQVIFVIDLSNLVRSHKLNKSKNSDDNYWIGTQVWAASQKLRLVYRSKRCYLEFSNNGRSHDFFKVTVTAHLLKSTD